MFKKPLSLIMALLMTLSAFAASPLTAFAEDTAAETDAHEEITDLKTVDRSADRDIAAVGSDLIDSDYPDYEYVLLDDGTAKITFFQTMFMPSEIRVPETLGGHQVTETGTFIFRFYKEISKIILPKGLKTIGRYTSSGCTNLTEVVIPDTVTSIGEGAFYGSPKLTSVDIPASVTEIGPLAFGYYWDSASETDAKISKLTIRGKKGSAAEKYAKDNGFTFEEYDMPTDISSGNTGSCKWELSKDNKLNIFGSGAMGDYSSDGSNAPWAAHKDIISEVKIERGVTNVGTGAFAGITSLKKLEISGSVKYIGEYAFSGCTSLSSVTGLYTDEIRSHAFEGCASLSAVSISKVDYIRSNAFRDCSNLWSVSLPELVKYIEADAFNGCPILNKGSDYIRLNHNLIYMNPSRTGKTTIGAGFTTIAEEAFIGCKDITELVLPNSLKYINNKAFYDCTGVNSVIIPDPVVEIGDKAFGYYSGGKISGFTVYASEGSVGHKYAVANGFKYVKYTPDDTLNKGVTGECTWTLTYKGVLTIGGGEYMDDYMFQGESNPHPWESYASLITEIIIKDGVKNIGILAFPDFVNLKRVTLPKSLVDIGDSAFKGCSSLKTINLPDSVTSIGSGAFYGCSSLSDIKLGDRITNIGAGPFNNAGAFRRTAYYNNEDNWQNNALYLGKYLLEVKPEASGVFTVKDGTKLIAWWAFDECDKITEVKLPKSLAYINFAAFHECTSLKKINLQDTKVSYIAHQAFYKCGLTNITIPESVISLGSLAFASCNDLSDITISDNVKEIVDDSFKNTAFFNNEDNWSDNQLYCGKCLLSTREGITDCVVRPGTKLIAASSFTPTGKTLTSVKLPDTVKYINSGAFSGCVELKTVDLGKGVNEIASNTFFNCRALTDITLPDSVTRLGTSAFEQCDSLTDVRLSKNLTELPESAFSRCESLKTVKLPDNLSSIGKYAFIKCDSLTEITIPDSVKTIDEYAFGNCSGLAKVTLSKNLTEIKRESFSKCGSLKSITIPDSVTKISESAFEYCESLSQVNIGNGVNTIDKEAFYGCPKLKSVTIPRNVKTIGDRAFGYHYIISYNEFYDVPYEGFTVTGYKGSEAQRYADDNGFAFTALPSSGVTVSGSIASYLSDTDNITVELIGVDSVTVKGNTSSYSIYDVAPGTYTLRVTKNDHVTSDQKITVKDKDVTQDVKLCPFGDVNGDGKTNVQDCTAILRYVRKLDTSLSEYQLKCADVTDDGKVNVQDVTRILRHIRKLAMLY